MTTEKPKKRARAVLESGSDDDEAPLASLSQSQTTVKKEQDSDYDEDDDVALRSLPKKKKETSSTSKTKKTTTVKKETKNKSDKSKKTTVKKEKKDDESGPKKKKVKKEETVEATPEPKTEDEKEEVFKWWEKEDFDDEIKWTTLEHNGVVFPPEYEPLPKHVKLIYDGKPVSLPIEAEEVAGFFGAMVDTDHAQNPVFQKNFFEDFKQVLKESGGCPDADIKEFKKMDFSLMKQHFEMLKEQKKLLTSADKKRLKQEKEEFEEKYKYCYLDGRKEQVGNFRIEPPGLFRGRGAHPKTGKLKRRVKPEDVVINIGKEAKIPEPPAGHQWAEVKHDNTGAWLAMWRENILNSFKYVRFAANSSLKGISDFKKFEKARELKKYIDIIRVDYRKKLKSELMIERQIATATYLIDVFALRAGGEKSDDEADTVGCCSLRYEHIFLRQPQTVIFDFPGKDSIRFYQEVEVDKQVFKNLRIFKKEPKKPGDDLFDRIDPSVLNKYFQGFMTGLTAKCFRTYNASKTMQDQLDLVPNTGTVNEKVVAFNAANRAVAILCNHQRTVAKNHDVGVQKINDKIKEMLWQKIRTKRMIIQLDKKLLKKDSKYFEEIDDLTKEDEQAIYEAIIERENEKAIKKFEKDNEKLKTEGSKPLPKSELDEKLKKIKELSKEYAKELKTGKFDIKSNVTVDKLKLQVEKLETRIKNTSLQLKDKEDNSQVALGTSKINYIDPRLTVMFSKKYDVPIEKLFTKTLRDKFAWAIESADENWRF